MSQEGGSVLDTMLMEESDDDDNVNPPPLACALSTYTDFLASVTSIPYVFLYLPEGETDMLRPRRMANVKKEGYASAFFFTVATEVARNRTLCLDRCVFVIFMARFYMEYSQPAPTLNDDDDDDGMDVFESYAETFFKATNHDLAFLIYQDKDGNVKSHLRMKTHVHCYSFWHQMFSSIDNTGHLDLDAFMDNLKNHEPPPPSVSENMLDAFDDLMDGFGDDSGEKKDAVTCDAILNDLVPKLEQIAKDYQE